jgi:hypothetical protein
MLPGPLPLTVWGVFTDMVYKTPCFVTKVLRLVNIP